MPDYFVLVKMSFLYEQMKNRDTVDDLIIENEVRDDGIDGDWSTADVVSPEPKVAKMLIY